MLHSPHHTIIGTAAGAMHSIMITAACVCLLCCTPCTAQQTTGHKEIKTSKTAPKNAAEPNDAAAFIAPKMALVKGGQFIMGSDRNVPNDEIAEGPAHKVNLSSYWIGKYEVTVAEFRKFMNTHTYVTDAEKTGASYSFDGKGLIYEKGNVNWECDVFGNKRVNQENHPVIHVSQQDAKAYCAWLSKQTGKTYRLPTEAEWEYAAKGGTAHDTFDYSGGDDMEELGWYAWNSDFITHPVGEKKPNRLGLYDMSGNAWEWCSDVLGPYSATEQTNPKGADTGSRVIMRGGGWRYNAVRCRNTGRRSMEPAFNGSGPGFRVAYTAE